MEWFRKLGYYKNPLETNGLITADAPLRYEDKVKDLLYFIESGSLVIIKGPKHSGKTWLASQIISKHKGKGKVIYLDLDKYNDEIDIANVLIGNQNLLRRFRNLYPKNMILIIDNAISLNNDFYKRLQFFYDQGYIKSAIFIFKSDELVQLPSSIISRVGNKHINLDKLNKDNCINLVERRLNGSLLSTEHIEYIYDNSINFEDFMFNVSKILEHYIEKDRSRIDINFIKKVLN